MTPMDAAIAAMDHPWRWGVYDCCASACTAFHLLHGIDPMGELRGAYGNAAEAEAAISARGGWEDMTDALAKAAGLNACAGRAGAIGLHQGPFWPSLVIGLGGDLWAGKTVRGWAVVRGVERAWI